MEKFTANFSSEPVAAGSGRPWALAGVVGSGNLEVLFERNPEAPGSFACHVETSFPGHKDSWLAALGDFAANYPVGGLRATVHDQGAAPIVVTFRLRQALDHISHPQP